MRSRWMCVWAWMLCIYMQPPTHNTWPLHDLLYYFHPPLASFFHLWSDSWLTLPFLMTTTRLLKAHIKYLRTHAMFGQKLFQCLCWFVASYIDSQNLITNGKMPHSIIHSRCADCEFSIASSPYLISWMNGVRTRCNAPQVLRLSLLFCNSMRAFMSPLFSMRHCKIIDALPPFIRAGVICACLRFFQLQLVAYTWMCTNYHTFCVCLRAGGN